MKRNLNNRIIAGVCSGIADHLGVDPLFIRLAFLFAASFELGAGIIAYLIFWLLM